MVLVTSSFRYWPLVSFLAAGACLSEPASGVRAVRLPGRKGSVGQMVEAEFLPAVFQAAELTTSPSRSRPSREKVLRASASPRRGAGRPGRGATMREVSPCSSSAALPRSSTGGHIRIDKKDISLGDARFAVTQIALVMQHNMVFSDTVANNTGRGDPAFAAAHRRGGQGRSMRIAFIQKLPQGYERDRRAGASAFGRGQVPDRAARAIRRPGHPRHRRAGQSERRPRPDRRLRKRPPGQTVIFSCRTAFDDP